jgi:hypothetical protein
MQKSNKFLDLFYKLLAQGLEVEQAISETRNKLNKKKFFKKKRIKRKRK